MILDEHKFGPQIVPKLNLAYPKLICTSYLQFEFEACKLKHACAIRSILRKHIGTFTTV